MTDRYMTHEERMVKAHASVRAQAAKGMAAAREWREARAPLPPQSSSCYRCDDAGIIKTYGGRAGEGGRTGPCPNCRLEAAARFVASINPFGEGRHFAEPQGRK